MYDWLQGRDNTATDVVSYDTTSGPMYTSRCLQSKRTTVAIQPALSRKSSKFKSEILRRYIYTCIAIVSA